MRLDRSLIAELPSFAGIKGEDLDFILSMAQSQLLPKDAEVFQQDDEANRFFLLLSGHIRVLRMTPDGERVIARYINEGELFGIAVALGRSTYPASAVTVDDCVVLSWPQSAWAEIQSRVPAFGANAYRTIGTRLQETQMRVVQMSTQQVEQRIAGAVMRLANQTGLKTQEGIEIGFPITRQEIAEMTGTTLYTVSRVLSAWEQQGIVRSSRQRVVVTNPHALFLLSENRRQK